MEILQKSALRRMYEYRSIQKSCVLLFGGSYHPKNTVSNKTKEIMEAGEQISIKAALTVPLRVK